MKRQFLALASAAAMIFGCTGCAVDAAQTAATTVPSPSPTENAVPSPTVMSKDEALRIGVETYEALLAAEFELYDNTEAALEQIYSLTTERLAEYRKGAEQAASNSYTAHGKLNTHNSQLQLVDADEIKFYTCVDLSTGYVTDQEGNVVGGDRTGKVGSYLIELVRESDGKWRIDRKDKWDATDRCS